MGKAQSKGARRPAPATAGKVADVSTLKADPLNPRRRTGRGRDLIVTSLKDYGAARSIVLDETNMVLAGNGVVEAAPDAGITKVRIIEAKGDEIIAVRRRGLTEAQKRALAIADNRTSELAEWNPDHVLGARELGVDLRPFFTPEEETALASQSAAAAVLRLAEGGAETTEETSSGGAADDYQQFSCSLTTDQERLVRAALRAARALYQVDTTGNALTAALKAWTSDHAKDEAPARGRRRRAS